MKLKQYIQTNHPAIYKEWEEYHAQELREYKRQYAKDNYGRVTPLKKEASE